MKEYFVYMLLCADGSYYIGVTSDYEGRLNQHQSDWDPKAYTHTRRPVKLVYLATFGDVHEAISWEKQIKGWSRKKKEALIKQDQKALEWFSKRSGVRKKAAEAPKS